jgi:hypothetical protein
MIPQRRNLRVAAPQPSVLQRLHARAGAIHPQVLALRKAFGLCHQTVW